MKCFARFTNWADWVAHTRFLFNCTLSQEEMDLFSNRFLLLQRNDLKTWISPHGNGSNQSTQISFLFAQKINRKQHGIQLMYINGAKKKSRVCVLHVMQFMFDRLRDYHFASYNNDNIHCTHRMNGCQAENNDSSSMIATKPSLFLCVIDLRWNIKS